VPLTAQDVAEITRLLEESDFLELRIEHEGFKLTLKRAPAAGSEASTGATTGAAASAPWRPAQAQHSRPRQPRTRRRCGSRMATSQDSRATPRCRR